MFNYKVMFRLFGVDHQITLQARDEDSALAHVFELHPESNNVRLWRDNALPLQSVSNPDNIIYIDFKTKKRIA